MCRIFPQVKKIIHDYRRISVLRKPKCAGWVVWIFLQWMVDGFLSWVVTASYSFCPAITKDGWMPALMKDHGCCFPPHTYAGVKTLQGKYFLMQSPRMDGCQLSRLIMAADFLRTQKQRQFFFQSTKYTYPVCAWQILPKAHRTWGLRFEQSNFLIFKICIACFNSCSKKVLNFTSIKSTQKFS